MPISTLDTILVPVASVEDARETCRAVHKYFGADGTVATFLFVVEKAGGAPDKASVEQREEVAETVFDAVGEELPDLEFETKTVYDTDVADGIFTAATDTDVDAIAFVPRSGGRIVRLLSGDVALSLVTENDVPVISLPSDSTPEEVSETSKGDKETDEPSEEEADQ